MTTDHSESTAFAESLTQNPYVLSPWNLTGFIIWARTADEDDIDQAIGVVSIVDHFNPRFPFGEPPVIIERPDLDREWTMLHLACTEGDCDLCRRAWGEYDFFWIGPWTCPTIVGDEDEDVHTISLRAGACGCGLHDMILR